MKKLIIPVLVFLVLITSSCDNVIAGYKAYGNSCEDTDEGWNYESLGDVILTGNRGERVKTDYCRDENRLVEYTCGRRYGGWIAFNRVVSCDREFGEGYICQEGVCVEENNFYDDFEDGELNENLWRVNGNMDEYGVENGVFHTGQVNAGDRYVNLMMLNQEFRTGDRVEYDVIYNSGSGNRMTNIIVDNFELNRYVGLMGYWNEVQQAGNEFGTYHFIVEFIENGVSIDVVRPDEEVVSIVHLPRIEGESHTFGVGTRTGHNGQVSMDFDNFEISRE